MTRPGGPRLTAVLLPFILVTVTGFNAQAQSAKIWRCGPDGRTYSQQPCADGKALEHSDRRTDADVRAANEALAREQALNRQLVADRQRREREAAARGSGMTGFKPAQPVAPASAASAVTKKQKREPGQHPPKGVSWQTAGVGISPAIVRASR